MLLCLSCGCSTDVPRSICWKTRSGDSPSDPTRRRERAMGRPHGPVVLGGTAPGPGSSAAAAPAGRESLHVSGRHPHDDQPRPSWSRVRNCSGGAASPRVHHDSWWENKSLESGRVTPEACNILERIAQTADQRSGVERVRPPHSRTRVEDFWGRHWDTRTS